MSNSTTSAFLTDGAAPLECARQSPVLTGSGKRLRRRGPRSNLALLRRSVPKQHRTLPGTSLGESRDIMSEISRIHKPFANENHHVDGVYIFEINKYTTFVVQKG